MIERFKYGRLMAQRGSRRLVSKCLHLRVLRTHTDVLPSAQHQTPQDVTSRKRLSILTRWYLAGEWTRGSQCLGAPSPFNNREPKSRAPVVNLLRDLTLKEIEGRKGKGKRSRARYSIADKAARAVMASVWDIKRPDSRLT